MQFGPASDVLIPTCLCSDKTIETRHRLSDIFQKWHNKQLLLKWHCSKT